jgi:hypothetical protein
LLEQPLFLCFVFFHRLLIAIVEGVFIYVFLGQAEHLEMKMDGIGGPRLKRAWVAWLGWGPAPPVLKWDSWPPSLTSCALGASRGKILMTEKS